MARQIRPSIIVSMFTVLRPPHFKPNSLNNNYFFTIIIFNLVLISHADQEFIWKIEEDHPFAKMYFIRSWISTTRTHLIDHLHLIPYKDLNAAG